MLATNQCCLGLAVAGPASFAVNVTSAVPAEEPSTQHLFACLKTTLLGRQKLSLHAPGLCWKTFDCCCYYHYLHAWVTQTDMCCSPLHTCRSCGGDESDTGKGELIPCRRCPKAFHEHCMPRSLLDLPGKNRKQRIWVAQFKNGASVPCEAAEAF